MKVFVAHVGGTSTIIENAKRYHPYNSYIWVESMTGKIHIFPYENMISFRVMENSK